MLSVFTENWRCILVLLVVVVVALKTVLGLDDATVDKLLYFVAGGATASATEGVVRKSAATKAAKAEAEAEPTQPSSLPPEGPPTDSAKM
jgi:hypothetical protein